MICACTLNKYNTTLANSNPSISIMLCVCKVFFYFVSCCYMVYFPFFSFQKYSCLAVLKAPFVFYVFRITDSYGIQLLITDYVWWLKDLWRDSTCKKAWPSSVRKAIGLDTEISLFSVFRPPRSRKTLAASKHWRFYICAGYMYHRQSKKQFDNSISLTSYVLITMLGVPTFIMYPVIYRMYLSRTVSFWPSS